MLSGHTDTITCCNYNPSGQVCIDCCLMIVVVNQWIVGQHGKTMEIENTWIELFLQSTRVGFELNLDFELNYDIDINGMKEELFVWISILLYLILLFLSCDSVVFVVCFWSERWFSEVVECENPSSRILRDDVTCRCWVDMNIPMWMTRKTPVWKCMIGLFAISLTHSFKTH